MDKTTLANLLFSLVGLLAFIAPIVVIARIIRQRGWGMRGRCIGIAVLMQIVTGAITSCIGFGGAGILLGGTFAARGDADVRAAMTLGGTLLVVALVITPLCHWLVLFLFRTSESRQPFATALRTTGATLVILVIAALLTAGTITIG